MTSSSLYLEVEHCQQVCAELRAELTKAKSDRVELAREVDEANERLAVMTEERDTLAKLLAAAEQQTQQLTLIALGELTIADIQAEFGRAGFIEGATNYDCDYEVDFAADQYATKVRQGGAA